MSQKYLLPCSCGKSVPIETAQAGSEVVCQCGQTLQVPSMMKIKKLRTLEEALAEEIAVGKTAPVQQSAEKVSSSQGIATTKEKPTGKTTEKPQEKSIGKSNKDYKVDKEPFRTSKTEVKTDIPEKSQSINSGLFTIGLLLLLASIGLTIYVVTQTTPKPQDVLRKRIYFHFGGKANYQDSTPLTYGDEVVLLVPDETIDNFNPVDAQRFWTYVKDGPAMSFNFNENYQTVKDYYILRCIGCGILNLAALALFISSFFLGRKQSVGTRRGTSWS